MKKEKIDNIGYGIVDLENIDWDIFCVLYNYFDIPKEENKDMIVNRYGSMRRILIIKSANVSQSTFGVDDIGFDYTAFQRMFYPRGIASNVNLSNFNLDSPLLGIMVNPSQMDTLIDLKNTYTDYWMNFENERNSITPLKYEDFININNKVYETNWYNLLFENNGLSFISNESLYEHEDKIFGLSVNPSQMDTLPNLWESYSDHWMGYSRDKFPGYYNIHNIDLDNSILCQHNLILEDNPNHWNRQYTINDSFPVLFNNEQTLNQYFSEEKYVSIFKNDYTLEDNPNHWNKQYTIINEFPILFDSNQTLDKYFNDEIKIELFKNDYTLEDNPNHWMREYTINDSFPVLFNNEQTLNQYFSEEKYVSIFKNDYTLKDNPNHWNKQYTINDYWLDIFNENKTLTANNYTQDISIGNLIYEFNIYNLLFEINGMDFISNESLYEHEDKIFGLSVNPSQMDTLPNLWESYSDHWMNLDNNSLPVLQYT
jgi:hypothetical protein